MHNHMLFGPVYGNKQLDDMEYFEQMSEFKLGDEMSWFDLKQRQQQNKDQNWGKIWI